MLPYSFENLAKEPTVHYSTQLPTIIFMSGHEYLKFLSPIE